MKKYYWNGISAKERRRALKDIRDIIEEYGEILDVQKISEVSTSIVIETEDNNVMGLRQNLNDIMSLEIAYEEDRTVQPLSLITLNLTFK